MMNVVEPAKNVAKPAWSKDSDHSHYLFSNEAGKRAVDAGSPVLS